MFVYRQHIPSAAKQLKKIHIIKRKSTDETILKKSLTPEKKKKIEFADNLLNGHSLSAGRQ